MSTPSAPVPQPVKPVALPIGIASAALGVFLLVGLPAILSDRHAPLALLSEMAGIVFCAAASLLCFLGRTRTRGERSLGIVIGTLAALGTLAGGSIAMWHAGKLGQEAIRGIQRQVSGHDRNSKTAVAEAGKAIPIAPNTLTAAQVRPLYMAWGEQHLVAPLGAHPTGDAARDEAARALLRGWVARWVHLDDEPTADQLREWQAAVSSGEDHPLIDFAIAALNPRDPARLQRLQRADQALAAWSDGATVLLLTRLELWHASPRTKGQPSSRTDGPVLEALKLALTARPITPGDHWAWQYLLTDGIGAEFIEASGESALAIIDAATALEPWLKHRVRGSYEVAAAWAARGNGWSNEVSRPGWKGFEAHLALARQELEEAWKLNPKNPGAAAQMITVAMGSSRNPATEMRLWFDRAVTARLDYSGAYSQLRWGLRPRWHGSTEAMLALGRACLATNRYDTWIPWEYYQALADIASEWDEPEAYYPERGNWAEVKRMLDGYLNAPHPPASHLAFLTRAAVLADRFHRPQDCRQYLTEANFTLDPVAASTLGVELRHWLPRTSAQSGPAAGTLHAADAAERKQDFDTAMSLLAQAAAISDLDAPARQYVQQRLDRLEAISKLQEVPWQPLLGPDGMTDWKPRFGELKAVTADLVEANQPMMLIRQEPVGATFELRGEVEFEPNAPDSMATFALGQPDNKSDKWLGVSLRRQDDGDCSVILARRYFDEPFTKRPTVPARSTVHLRVTAGLLSLTLNGATVIERPIDLPEALSPESRLALTLPRLRAGASTVRWHKLAWRRLPPDTVVPAK